MKNSKLKFLIRKGEYTKAKEYIVNSESDFDTIMKVMLDLSYNKNDLSVLFFAIYMYMTEKEQCEWWHEIIIEMITIEYFWVEGSYSLQLLLYKNLVRKTPSVYNLELLLDYDTHPDCVGIVDNKTKIKVAQEILKINSEHKQALQCINESSNNSETYMWEEAFEQYRYPELSKMLYQVRFDEIEVYFRDKDMQYISEVLTDITVDTESIIAYTFVMYMLSKGFSEEWIRIQRRIIESMLL